VIYLVKSGQSPHSPHTFYMLFESVHNFNYLFLRRADPSSNIVLTN